MVNIQAILADIDGTLTTGGNLQTIDIVLKDIIHKVRDCGILFTLASGRPYFEQEAFHKLITGRYHYGEGILYEGSCLRLFGNDKVYKLGGLTAEQLYEIKTFVSERDMMNGMVTQANNDRYETTMGYVTPTFITKGQTDVELLERKFAEVKPVLEEQFPFIDIVMSADAIDIIARGVTKELPTRKYSEMTGIPLSKMAVFGDSGNDMPMADVVGKAGGLVVYVGVNPKHKSTVFKYRNHFIPKNSGPMGSVAGLAYILGGIL